jgi:asparaginyl-tRNA synthetase
VYCFGPTFRAEKSKTRRHLTEFWMVEPEAAFLDLDGLLVLAEEFVTHIVKSVLANRRAELVTLERDLTKLEAIDTPFPRIRYDEAMKLLKEAGSETPYGEDLGAPDETLLSERFDRPLMVTHYPRQVKAFYMASDPEDENLVRCVDMLAPEGYGEIIGGSEREADHATLLRRMQEHDIAPESLQWYLDLRRYGTVPHSGFGLGVERVVTWLCGIHHLRETIPFPRMLNRIHP